MLSNDSQKALGGWLQAAKPVALKLSEQSDAIRLTSHLGENRVRTSLEVWPGMFHVWHLLAGILPEADQALRNAVRFFDDTLLLAYE